MNRFLYIALVFCFALEAAADTEPNNLAAEANPIANGGEVLGALEPGSDSEDWYSILIPANSELALDYATLALGRDGAGDTVVSIVPEGEDEAIQSYAVSASAPLHASIPIADEGRYLVKVALAERAQASPRYQLSAAIGPLSQRAVGGLYDGLWVIGNEGYATILQKGSQLALIILGNSEAFGFRWEAQIGEIRGNRALTSTVIGYVDLVLDIEFTSLQTASVTINSCSTIVAGNPCQYEDGTTFFINKLEEWPGEATQ